MMPPSLKLRSGGDDDETLGVEVVLVGERGRLRMREEDSTHSFQGKRERVS